MSKLNIFKSEWLDVVFENRNKDYGAYELRKLGPKATNTALLIVTVAVAAFSIPQAFNLKLFKSSEPPKEEIAFTEELTLEDLPELPEEEEKPPVQEEAPRIAESKPALDVVALPEIKPVPKEKVVEEVEVATTEEATDKKKLIGPVAMKGMKGGSITTEGKWGTKDVAGSATGSTKGVEGGTGEGDRIFESVEINPSPKKGMDAFRKWIADNYQYPSGAIDAGVKGTITVSFVVERNGELTDIKVLKDLSYGTGQAAINLLKKAEKWNPGIQNGRPVRVAYTLPIRLDLTQM
ncbi:energy transducer TonB [Parapedobacter sp. SGR-10]|uniref:energy transducer TonB n=1 Tax=Parapedobacter sp. SGR-10 TaxID=2710879 RepID=UPI0013D4A04C|nr:energy transducer TonB [Parapedobacter sp. SGR-10]NGF57199.1 energy transducer TonB [Parapedobacter sp. SGR-10]